MPTNTVTITWNDSYGASLKSYKDIADDASVVIDVTIDDGTVGQAIAVPITIAQTSVLYILSNTNLTLYRNGGNEVVTITLASATVGDTFRLIFGGQTTAPISFQASAATVQAALEALSSVGVGNVLVTGATGSPNSGPFTVTFVNSLGLTNVGAITVGTIATVSGATVTPSVVTNGSAASQTITLLAGIALAWFTGCGLAQPITGDITTLFATNISGQQSTLRIRELHNV